VLVVLILFALLDTREYVKPYLIHKPLIIIIKWDMLLNRIDHSNTMINCYKIITLPLYFENYEIKEEFNNLIRNEFSNYINMNRSRQDIIDSMYCHITSSIKSAYCKCSRVVSTNTVRKTKVGGQKN
jgi:hypothetical protein